MSLRSASPVVSAIMAIFAATACHAGESSMQKPVADGGAELSIDEVVGFWAIVSVSASGGSCHISLNRLPQADGYGVFIEKCSIARLSGATEWRPTRDGFEIRDGSHSAVMRFRRIDVDRFEATDGAYRVDRASLS